MATNHAQILPTNLWFDDMAFFVIQIELRLWESPPSVVAYIKACRVHEKKISDLPFLSFCSSSHPRGSTPRPLSSSLLPPVVLSVERLRGCSSIRQEEWHLGAEAGHNHPLFLNSILFLFYFLFWVFVFSTSYPPFYICFPLYYVFTSSHV